MVSFLLYLCSGCEAIARTRDCVEVPYVNETSHFVANSHRVNLKTVSLKIATLYSLVYSHLVLTYSGDLICKEHYRLSSFITSDALFVRTWSVRCKPQKQTGIVAPKFSGAVGQVRPALVSTQSLFTCNSSLQTAALHVNLPTVRKVASLTYWPYRIHHNEYFWFSLV